MRSGNGQSSLLDALSIPQMLSFISETFFLFSRMLYSTMSDAGAKTTVKKIGQSPEAPAGFLNQNLVVFEVIVVLLCRLICFLLSLSWLLGAVHKLRNTEWGGWGLPDLLQYYIGGVSPIYYNIT